VDYFQKNLEQVKLQLGVTENVICAIEATVGASFVGVATAKIGALALTSEQLIFRGGGSFFGFQQITLPLNSISQVDLKTEHIQGVGVLPLKGTMISVAHGGGIQSFGVTGANGIEEFMLAVSKAIGSAKLPHSQIGLSEELARLKELFDAGALTEDEFISAKSKLLN
jgi:Short C-terminal domain